MQTGKKKIRKEEMRNVHGGSEKSNSCQCGCKPAVQPKPVKCVPTETCGCPLKTEG